jgi:hypothetical protein
MISAQKLERAARFIAAGVKDPFFARELQTIAADMERAEIREETQPKSFACDNCRKDSDLQESFILTSIATGRRRKICCHCAGSVGELP